MWIKIFQLTSTLPEPLVTSFTLVWIKIDISAPDANHALVTSFTLVWIKIIPFQRQT